MPLREPSGNASLSELFRALSRDCALLDGRLLLDCALDATGAYAAFRHNLGRAYRGAIVIRQDSAQLVRICPPTDSNFPANTNAGTHLLVRPTTFGGATPAMTFSAWAF